MLRFIYIMKISNLILLLFFAYGSTAQDFKHVYVTRQLPEHSFGDTLFVQVLNPDNLDSLIQTSPELLTFFYKPYCRGLIEEKFGGLSPMDSVMRYCLKNKIPFAFIAVDLEGLNEIPQNYINKYQLRGIPCYVIDRSFATRIYDRLIIQSNKKNKKSCHYYRNGKIIQSYYSFNFELKKFIADRDETLRLK